MEAPTERGRCESTVPQTNHGGTTYIAPRGRNPVRCGCSSGGGGEGGGGSAGGGGEWLGIVHYGGRFLAVV
jgi:hypothetical protein